MSDDALQRIGRELLFSAFIGNSITAEQPWILERIATTLEEMEIHAGDVLYREGEPSDHLYFMSEGRVRLSRPDHPDWVYDGRWVMGTTNLLANRPRGRTAIAEMDALLFRLPGDLWIELLEDSFEITCNAIVGSARGTSGLYTRLAPDGGFSSVRQKPLHCDTTSLVGRALLFSSLPLLAGGGVQSLTDLASVTTMRELDPGEELFTAKTEPSHVHVVVRGLIELHRAEPGVTALFGKGLVLGEALALGNTGGSWAARAVERSSVLSFSVEDWFNQMEEHPEMARGAMAALALERERLYDELAKRIGELVLH